MPGTRVAREGVDAYVPGVGLAGAPGSVTLPQWLPVLLVFVACSLLAILAQWRSGALTGDFGVYTDESGHYVTGLMIRDFLLSGESPRHAIQFAERYYAHYPDVAIGHWPPLLYIVEALWSLVFGVSRTAFLLLSAIAVGGISAMIFAAGKRYSWTAAAIAAAVFPLLRVTRYSLDWVGSDIAVTFLLVLATDRWFKFLESEKRKDAILFGVLAAAAVLTKGTGWIAGLIPPITILLTRRFALLRDASVWIAAVVAGLLCLPWQIATLGITESAWQYSPGIAFMRTAAPLIASLAAQALGFPLLIVIAVAGGLALRRSRVAPDHLASWIALPAATVAFQLIVPAGIEDRFLLPVFAGLLVCACAAVVPIVALIERHAPSLATPGEFAVLAMAFAYPVWNGWNVAAPTTTGLGEAASVMSRDPSLEGKAFLVSSDRQHEVAFVAELAMRDSNRPSFIALRAGKVLAHEDWNGRDYSLKVETTEQVDSLLRSVPVTEVVLDGVPTRRAIPHHDLLMATMIAYPEHWRPDRAFQVAAGQPYVQAYRYVGPASMTAPLELDVKGRKIPVQTKK